MNRLLILTLLLLMALSGCSKEIPDVEQPPTETPLSESALPTLEVTSTVAKSYPEPLATPEPYAPPATTVAISTPLSVPLITTAISTPESLLASTATAEITESPVPTEIAIETAESMPTVAVGNLGIDSPQPTMMVIEEAEPTPEPMMKATTAAEVEAEALAEATTAAEVEAVAEATTAPEQYFPPACQLAPEARLATLLQSRTALAEKLGCPIAAPEQTWAAWALFEQDNQMVWLENQDLIFAIYDDFWHGYEDTFEEGEPEVPPDAPQPTKAGHIIPIRGFGKVWIQIPEEMGFAVSEESGYDATRQRFENGWLVTTPYGQVLALLELTNNPLTQAPVQSWLERDGEWVGED